MRDEVRVGGGVREVSYSWFILGSRSGYEVNISDPNPQTWGLPTLL